MKPYVAFAARPRVLRRIACLMLAAAFGAIAVIAAAGLVLAANGALTTRTGAWTATVDIAPHVPLRVNVAGILRFATSEPGLALLDGRIYTVGASALRIRRAGSVLVIDCEPCRLQLPWLAARPLVMDHVHLQLARAPQRGGAAISKAASDRIEGRATVGALELPFSLSLQHDAVDIDWSVDDGAAGALYAAFAAAIPETRFAQIAGRFDARGHVALPTGHATTHVEFRSLDADGLGGELLRANDLIAGCAAQPGTRTAGARPAGVVSLGAVTPGAMTSGARTEDARTEDLPSNDARSNGLRTNELFGARLPATVLTVVAFAAGGYAVPPIDLQTSDQLTHVASSASAAAMPAANAAWPHLLAQAQLASDAEHATLLDQLRLRLYGADFAHSIPPERGLELLLASARWGGNVWGAHVCGARAASRLYFNKPPSRLTALEAAWLAAALVTPRRAFEQQFLRRAPDNDAARRVLDRTHDVPLAERSLALGERLVFAPVPAELQLGPARIARAAENGATILEQAGGR